MITNKNNKKGFFSSIIGAVLLLVVISVSSYLIMSNMDSFSNFNKKMNETINYSQSDSLKIPNFDLEERRDALKIFLPTQILSNVENFNEISNYFETFKKDCMDNKYSNCFKIDDTFISCNKESCFVENFHLEDNIEDFIDGTSGGKETIQLIKDDGTIKTFYEIDKNCAYENYPKLTENEIYNCIDLERLIQTCNEKLIYNYDLDYYCDLIKTDSGYSYKNNKAAINEYKKKFGLPTRYITFGNLPELEIENLKSSFKEEGSFASIILNLAYISLNSVQVLQTTGDILKFVSKSNPDLIMKMVTKISPIAFINANKGNKITTFFKNFAPDIFKYTDAISGEKVSYLFLDENLVDFYTKAKKFATNLDEDDFIKKIGDLGYDISDKVKLKSFYNSFSENIPNSNILKNTDLQYAFELSSATKKKSIAKTLFSNALTAMITKSDEKESISFLNLIYKSFSNYNDYSNLRSIMEESINTYDDILEKIMKQNYDFSPVEKETLRNFFNEIAPDFFSKNTNDLNNLDSLIKSTLKNSDEIQSVLTQNLNILKGDSILNSKDLMFTDQNLELLFAGSTKFLSNFLNDGTFSEDIVQLVLENNFAKISKTTIKDDFIKNIFSKKINNIDIKSFKSDEIIKVVNNENIVKFSKSKTIVVEANGEFYETTGAVFDEIRKTTGLAHSDTGQFVGGKYYDPLRFQTALIQNDATPKLTFSNTEINIKILPTSKINTISGIDPTQKLDFIKSLGSDFPLVNTENVDDVFDALTKYSKNNMELEDLLDYDSLSVIQDKDIFEEIGRNLILSDTAKKNIITSTEILTKYDNIITEFSTKSAKELQPTFNKLIFNSIDTAEMTKFIDAFITENNFYETIVKNTPDNFFTDVFNKDFVKNLKNVGNTAFEIYAFDTCSNIIVDALDAKIYDLDPIKIINNKNIMNNITEYKTEIEDDGDNLFIQFIKEKTGEDDFKNIKNAAFAEYCVIHGSINLRKSLARVLFNYFEEENAFYLPNQISSIDTISLYNKDNYYAFDQLEYFSPLELDNYEDYLMRLKKNNEEWIDSFYLVSPCQTNLTFTINESVQCKYDADDLVYNGYTLEGDTEGLKEQCKEIDYNFEINDNKKIDIDYVENTKSDIKNFKYSNMINNVIRINEFNPTVISNFLYMLFDRNMEYTSYYFLKDTEDDNYDNMNLYYYNLFKEASYYNSDTATSTLINIQSYNLNNYVQRIFSNDNELSKGKNDMNFFILLNDTKDISPFLKNELYKKYNIPFFTINYSYYGNIELYNIDFNISTDIREYNNLNYIYEENNQNFDNKYVPIVLNIPKETFKNNLANIDFEDINKYKLSEEEFNLYLKDYKENTFNKYPDFYIFDIIYNFDNNFNYKNYEDYFKTFNTTKIFESNDGHENSNSISLKPEKIDGIQKTSFDEYPTLMESILLLDSFEEQIIDFTDLSNNKKKVYTTDSLKKIFQIVYDNNLHNFAIDYFENNKLVYYNCSNVNYDELKKYTIIKNCDTNLENGKNIEQKAKSIDITLSDITDDSYCYYYTDGIMEWYENNNKKMSWIMAAPGLVGGFISVTPLGIALNVIDVAYSFFDVMMPKIIEEANRWPNSVVAKKNALNDK